MRLAPTRPPAQRFLHLPHHTAAVVLVPGAVGDDALLPSAVLQANGGGNSVRRLPGSFGGWSGHVRHINMCRACWHAYCAARPAAARAAAAGAACCLGSGRQGSGSSLHCGHATQPGPSTHKGHSAQPEPSTHQRKVQVYLQRPRPLLHQPVAVAWRLPLGRRQQRAWLLARRRLRRCCAARVAHGAREGACACWPCAAAACRRRCLPGERRGCRCSLLLRRLLVAIHRC